MPEFLLLLFMIAQQPQLDPVSLPEAELERLIQERARRILTGSVSPVIAQPPSPPAPVVKVSADLPSQPAIPDEPPLRALARRTAREIGVPEHLALGLIEVESSWQTKAVSNKGAVGLAQVLPSTAHGIWFTCDLFEPACNLKAGFTYLKAMLETFVDPRLALAAYNAGPGVFGKNYAPETRQGILQYVRDVIETANRIRNTTYSTGVKN